MQINLQVRIECQVQGVGERPSALGVPQPLVGRVQAAATRIPAWATSQRVEHQVQGACQPSESVVANPANTQAPVLADAQNKASTFPAGLGKGVLLQNEDGEERNDMKKEG